MKRINILVMNRLNTEFNQSCLIALRRYVNSRVSINVMLRLGAHRRNKSHGS